MPSQYTKIYDREPTAPDSDYPGVAVTGARPETANSKRKPDFSSLRLQAGTDFLNTSHQEFEIQVTGVSAVDCQLQGLPREAITEIVTLQPSTGGTLALYCLLGTLRRQRGFVALIDGCNSFDPVSAGKNTIEHLLWIRCQDTNQALKVTDILLRDENLALILLDLRWNEERELRKAHATLWYRLQRLARHTGGTLIVFTPKAIIPSAQVRLSMSGQYRIWSMDMERTKLVSQLKTEVLRNRLASIDEPETRTGTV